MADGLFTEHLEVVVQDTSFGAQPDLDYALHLLAAAREGAVAPTVRIYRPRPTAAFGQRDVRLHGYVAATARCRDAGYTPTVRKSGGRVAIYDEGAVIIDHVQPHPDPIVGSQTRYQEFSAVIADALERAGVSTGIGELPGEYCPGEHSVFGTDGVHRAKLVGVAQRVIAGAWLISAVVSVRDTASLRTLITDVYGDLELPLDADTIGSASDFAPALTADSFIEHLVWAYGRRANLTVR
ncbi:lipoate--protein ligase family protein [Tersicoccus sp. MR15.9]|uniref:lipoyl protein ligase domain-containing protein n=1 Tax=Tersicoccus mangrovi TaxID=3121635 RepID=UPI002FE5471C